MNRGTYNQIVHLGRGDNLTAVNVVAPGESGLTGNPHFADQLSLYATWHYKPMRLTRKDLTGRITTDIVLHVPGTAAQAIDPPPAIRSDGARNRH